jgi:hypothetical protein
MDALATGVAEERERVGDLEAKLAAIRELLANHEEEMRAARERLGVLGEADKELTTARERLLRMEKEIAVYDVRSKQQLEDLSALFEVDAERQRQQITNLAMLLRERDEQLTALRSQRVGADSSAAGGSTEPIRIVRECTNGISCETNPEVASVSSCEPTDSNEVGSSACNFVPPPAAPVQDDGVVSEHTSDGEPLLPSCGEALATAADGAAAEPGSTPWDHLPQRQPTEMESTINEEALANSGEPATVHTDGFNPPNGIEIKPDSNHDQKESLVGEPSRELQSSPHGSKDQLETILSIPS